MTEDLKCTTCGRIYPWQIPKEKCPVCKTYFTRGTCYVCRRYSDIIRHGKCNDCSREIKRKSVARQRAAAKTEYSEWIKMIVDIPKPVHTLTEDEWLRNCKFFNGCALCGAPQIEARLLYIPAHRGGTYTKYNVVPGCEKCATSYKQHIKAKGDPFSGASYNGLSADRARVKVVKSYLKEMYDEYRQANCIQ